MRVSLILLVFANLIISSATLLGQTVRKQRVIGIYNRPFNSIRYNDSIVLKYSGSRGSSFLAYGYNMWSYYSYGFFLSKSDYSYPFILLDLHGKPAPFIRLEDVAQYDTLRSYTLMPVGMIPSTYRACQYNDSNQILNLTESFWSGYHHYHSALGTNRKTETMYYVFQDTVRKFIDTNLVRHSYYNSSGLRWIDTFVAKGTPRPYSTYIYSYNIDGQLTEILYRQKNQYKIWEDHRRLQYHYNNNSLASAATEDLWVSSTGQSLNYRWETRRSESVKYDAQERVSEITQSYLTNRGMRTNTSTLHYNTLNEADTIYYKDSLGNESKVTFFYNSFHNPDSAWLLIKNMSSGTWLKTYTTYYKYEEYDATEIILVPSTSNLILYPNPADDMIVIKWNDKLQDDPVSVLIYNGSGHLVRSSYIEHLRQKNTIDLSGIAAGAYYIRIITTSGGLLYAGIIYIGK